MRFLFGFLTLAFGLVLSAPTGNETEPDIRVTASFSEDNPFGNVVNGEKNQIVLHVENKSDRNVTLTTVSGSVLNAETDTLIKNLTTLTYGIRLIENVTLQVPYQFYSEFKPGDLRLNIWMNHVVDDESYQLTAYDSIVTVVEPEASLFHYEVIITYLITSLFLGGLAYFAYISFVPSTRKAKKGRRANISEPVGSVTATGAGGYQEEWIPEHHLKKSASKKGGKLTSGDELSGGETSGTEGPKKRKGKK